MTRPPATKRAQLLAAARARNAKSAKSNASTQSSRSQSTVEIDSRPSTPTSIPYKYRSPEVIDLTADSPAESSDSEVQECGWSGDVNHNIPSEYEWADSSELEEESDEELCELEGEELVEGLGKAMENERKIMSLHEKLLQKHTKAYWKQAEAKRGFGYTGNSERSKRRQAQVAREKAALILPAKEQI